MPVKRFLFVCVENANRSQMAEAWCRGLGGEAVEAFSAGSRPSGKVNSKAIESMREIGFDLGAHRSGGFEELPDTSFDVVVTMGCGDACPAVPAGEVVEWDIPDPRDMDPEAFAAVRDRIGRDVESLLRRQGVEPSRRAIGSRS